MFCCGDILDFFTGAGVLYLGVFLQQNTVVSILLLYLIVLNNENTMLKLYSSIMEKMYDMDKSIVERNPEHICFICYPTNQNIIGQTRKKYFSRQRKNI